MALCFGDEAVLKCSGALVSRFVIGVDILIVIVLFARLELCVWSKDLFFVMDLKLKLFLITVLAISFVKRNHLLLRNVWLVLLKLLLNNCVIVEKRVLSPLHVLYQILRFFLALKCNFIDMKCRLFIARFNLFMFYFKATFLDWHKFIFFKRHLNIVHRREGLWLEEGILGLLLRWWSGCLPVLILIIKLSILIV